MCEIPTTVGFLRGAHRRRAAIRRFVMRSGLRRFGVIGALDRSGLVARRWLSPETSSGPDMVRLVQACVRSKEPVLGMTFHSAALLPGATPFVRHVEDKRRFLEAIRMVLRFCSEAGLSFRKLIEVGEDIVGTPATSSAL